ncbi:MAG: NTP transferase domain-containing protein [Pseudomonadota bacterium]
MSDIVLSERGVQSLAVLLAGGDGRRMGGVDKGGLMLAGQRLVDHAYARLAPQADRLVIAGPHNYGLDIPAVADRADGPAGPCAGLWAAAAWVELHAADVPYLLTAPVDGPFAPRDLNARLCVDAGSAIACDPEGRAHPTFARWRLADLKPVLKEMQGQGLSLHALAQACEAGRIVFPQTHGFFNVNTPEDLVRAETISSRFH